MRPAARRGNLLPYMGGGDQDAGLKNLFDPISVTQIPRPPCISHMESDHEEVRQRVWDLMDIAGA